MNGEFKVLGRLRNESIEVGEWSCDPCTFELRFSWDETAYFLKGSVSLENLDSKEKFQVTEGCYFVFPKGSFWRWTVHSVTKKIFTAIE